MEDVTSMDDQIRNNERSIQKVETDLEKVEGRIEKVETEIAEAETELRKEDLSDGDKTYYRQEKSNLRQKERQLREEESQLREEKSQLRAKEILLLQNQQDQPEGQPGTLAHQRDGRQSGLLYIKKDHTVRYGKSVNNIGPVEKTENHKYQIRKLPSYTCAKVKTAIDSVMVGSNGEINQDMLVQLVPQLNSSMVKGAVTDSQVAYEVREKDMGEMVFQQLVYSCFSRLFMAAAGDCSTRRYAADQNVRSSLSVQFQDDEKGVPDEGKLIMQPGAAATLKDRQDAFGMMEIKPNSGCVDQHYLTDNDKCVLMTAATSIVLSRCFSDVVGVGGIALPFVIATGRSCCLYVTRMESLGHGPYVQEVDLSCEGNNRSMPVDCVKSPSPSKARVLVALAVLLNNFLEFFTDERKQKYRQESVVVAPVPNSLPSVFTRRTNRNENADKKSSKRQQSHTASTEGTSGKEVVAMKAAACGNLFRQIEYPWTRVVHFTDSDLVFEEQTESPFYFKALREMDRKKVFLKVWNSFEVETGDIEDEWHFQCKAYQAGVSVATLMSESLLRSSGEDNAEYLVLAMEFVESDSIRGALDCMLFSYKLIETVESLHTAAGMLHGDLKPRNVIWGKGVVTLIDFGRSSSIVSEERTCSRGTEGYEAPEILRGDPNTISTDAFAVGKTILWHIERLVKDEAALCSRLKGIAEGLASENPSTRWSLTRASKAIVVQLSSQNRSEEPQQGMNSYSQRSPPKKIARVSVGDLSVAVS